VVLEQCHGRRDQKSVTGFMKDGMYIAVGFTHVLLMSDNVISATPSYNSIKKYLPQAQVLFLFSMDHYIPAYFCMMPGSVNSVNLDYGTNDIFRISLFIIKNHSNSPGSIATSCDSDILEISHDGYYYMWPRDASVAAYALSIAGHSKI
jgi:hypothetical protein